MRRLWRPGWPVDLDLVLGPLTRGGNDPTARGVRPQQWWLTGSLDSGPVALHLRRQGDNVIGEAAGEGSQEMLHLMPRLLGADDDPTGFRPEPGTVVAVWWARAGRTWRVPASGLVWATAVQAILEQKVTGIESRASWFRLCAEHGRPAPGAAPAGMRIAPGRDAVAAIPSWWWRQHGVDHARAATILRLARVRLPSDPAQVRRRLAAVPGIGAWTLAEVGLRALGDSDAVSVGDFHLANRVGYALTGRPRSSDEQMLELLAPYAGHRHRAVRMIELSGISPPRFGPRVRLPTHR